MALSLGAVGARGDDRRVEAPCSDRETWTLDGRTVKVRAESPFALFAEVKALGRDPKSDKNVTDPFSEYALGRVWFTLEVYEAAAERFNRLLETATTPEPLRFAAFHCLALARHKYAVSLFSEAALAAVPALYTEQRAKDSDLKARFADALALLALKQIRDGKPADAIEATLKGVDPASAYALFVRGTWAAKRGDDKEAIAQLTKLVAADTPTTLKPHRSAVRALLASLLYDAGNGAESARQFDEIDDETAEWPRALVGMAWQKFEAGDYSRAMKRAMGLQAKSFRRTFAPEGLLVTAMALNELCQFPEALQALRTYRRNYRPSFDWLREHAANKGDRYYTLAADSLRPETAGATPDVPARITTEWTSSPVFVANRAAIDFNDARRKEWGERRREAKERIAEDEKKWRERRDEFAKRTPAKTPDEITDATKESEAVSALERRYRMLAAADAPWSDALDAADDLLEKRGAQLRERVDTELRAVNHRLLEQLTAWNESAELIESEVWSSVGQEIVARRGFPEYETLTRTISTDRENAPDYLRVHAENICRREK